MRSLTGLRPRAPLYEGSMIEMKIVRMNSPTLRAAGFPNNELLVSQRDHSVGA